MLRKLSMCLIYVALSGVGGCKGKGSDRGANPAGGKNRPASAHATLGVTGKGQVTRRDDGTLAVSSPDGTQVILLKQGVADGQTVGLYQLCDATGTTLQCGDWVRIDSATPCTQCFAEPCPCTNPACASVCKPL